MKFPAAFLPLDADGDELHRDAGTGLSRGWSLRQDMIGRFGIGFAILIGAVAFLRPLKAGLIALQYRHRRLGPSPS